MTVRERSPRLLLIDGNSEDRELASLVLAQTFPHMELTEVADAVQFAEVLSVGGYELVITEASLPWADGLAILRAVKKRNPECPVLMFTVSDHEEAARKGLRMGLDDYLLKHTSGYLRLGDAAQAALDRNRASRTSLALEPRLQSLLSQAQMGTFRYSADGHLLDASSVLLRWLGQDSLKDAQGRTLTEIGLGLVASAERLQRLKDSGYLHEPEIEIARREGGPTWVSLTQVMSTSCAGETVIDGLLQDISERKMTERALERRAADLQRSNAELEQLTHIASHDLQEPLRMVARYTEMLKQRYRGRLDADADEFITYAHEGATRMQTLINDLLSYSRVGTQGRPFAPVNMDEAFEQATANLRAAITDSGALITHDPLPGVVADGQQMVQLLQNLLSNAIKFRGDAPPHVHLSSERKGDERVFAVRDRGIGIPPRDSERIFGMFQRLHTDREYPGTGIGLAICKKIMERHGGRIWVRSEPGKGSTFYFSLPERAHG